MTRYDFHEFCRGNLVPVKLRDKFVHHSWKIINEFKLGYRTMVFWNTIKTFAEHGHDIVIIGDSYSPAPRRGQIRRRKWGVTRKATGGMIQGVHQESSPSENISGFERRS